MPKVNDKLQHNLMHGTQTASMWIDESGSRTTARDCFVVAGIKTRNPDQLQREMHSIRDRHQAHTSELKFGRVDGHASKVLLDAIDLLADSNVRIMASVIDGSAYNPFNDTAEPWRAHAYVMGRMIQANINRNEVVTVMMDGMTTPEGISMGHVVKRAVNGRIGTTSVVEAVSLNSKSNDLLQLADMVAGSIFYQRLRTRKGEQDPLKVKIAQRLAWAFDVPDFKHDRRNEKLYVSTLDAPRDSRWAEDKTGASTRSRSARR